MGWRANVILSSVFFFLSIPPVSAEIYKWRDENGKLHFSDKRTGGGASQQVDFFDSKAENVNREDSKTQVMPNTDQEKSPVKPMATKKITAADYNINPVIEKRSGELYIYGRLEGGPACPRLTIKFSAQSDKGGALHTLTAVVKNAGSFGSLLYEARTAENREGRWTISEITAECN